MDEKLKNFWKKVFTSRITLVIGLPIAAFLVSLLGVMIWGNSDWADNWVIVIAGTVGGAVIAWLILFFRWVFFVSWRRTLLRLAGLAALVALFYAEEDWRGWHAWNQFKHEWEAKGEKFAFKDFVPPPVPDEQNFALTPVVFTGYGSMLTRDGKVIPYEKRDPNFVNRLAMEIYPQHEYGNTNLNFGSWQKARLTDLRPWQEAYRHPKADSSNPNATVTNEFPVATQPQTPAADVLLALSRYDAAIEDLRQASRLPASRFPLNYDDENPAVILLPHLAALKRCSQVLSLRSLAELQNGQSEKALADVKLTLRLTDSTRTEPFLISHLVHIALFQITLQPIYEGLAKHQWSDEQLVALNAELAKLDFLETYKFAMRGELASESAMCDLIREKPEYLAMFFGESSGPPFTAKLVCHAIPSGWLYQNQLNCARSMVNFYVPLADSTNRIFSVNLCRQGEVNLNATRTPWAIFNYMKSMLLPALGACAKKFAHTQTSVDLARTAIALERYRLAHGEFPASLAALAPQFIAKVPHDVIGGQPLKYRREADGQFVLYSVGWNEKDDGGVVVIPKGGSQPKYDEGDWVWRYPQK